MKKIYGLLFFLLLGCLVASAAPEAEYKKLSKAYTLNTDGSMEYRFTMELTLYTHTAMNRTYGESFVVYNPKFQEVKIHSSYTKQKDGSIIKTPENAFMEVLPRQAADAPDYNHLKELVIVHTGLELGATIYLDYSVVTKPGYLPGLDICDPIEQTSPVNNLTIRLSAPADRKLSYTLLNSPEKPAVKSESGQQTVTWNIRNLPAASLEPGATAMGGDVRLLITSTYGSQAVALQALSRQLAKANDMPLLSLAETVTEGCKTVIGQLQAIQAHVADNIGSSRLTLAETGFRIRPTDDIMKTVYGTEAEKANLLAGLLQAIGIKAEVAASFLKGSVPESNGLGSIQHLLVVAVVDGQTYLLDPNRKDMSNAGWYAGYLDVLSVTRPGEPITLPEPDVKTAYQYAITVSPAEATITTQGTTGKSLLPYPGAATETGKSTQPLKTVGGYALLALPVAPTSLSDAAYGRYNSTRNTNLLLPYKADEQYDYAVELPAGMELSTPAANRTIDNAAGTLTYTVRPNGRIVEVTRSLKLKKQLITKADYAAFRTLMAEWSDTNHRQLLIKMQ